MLNMTISLDPKLFSHSTFDSYIHSFFFVNFSINKNSIKNLLLLSSTNCALFLIKYAKYIKNG